MLWTDLEPEPGLLFALEHAGSRPEDGNQNEKRGWSERLANACAVAIAPRALMTGIFFLPIAAATDKTKGKSSFAHTVVKLRERTGRLDPSLAHHAHRCDCAFVGLYTTGTERGYPAGIVRFLNVAEAPPFRGRPIVESTRGLNLNRAQCGMRCFWMGSAPADFRTAGAGAV